MVSAQMFVCFCCLLGTALTFSDPRFTSEEEDEEDDYDPDCPEVETSLWETAPPCPTTTTSTPTTATTTSPTEADAEKALGVLFDGNKLRERGRPKEDRLFEGDIAGLDDSTLSRRVVMSEDLNSGPPTNPDEDRSMGAVNDPMKLWAHGEIPYRISPSYTAVQRRRIREAMRYIESKSCIRFLKKTTEHSSYVEIRKTIRGGCWSYVGKWSRLPGAQVISLEDECIENKQIIVHELLHALGFFHEQNRADRADYVEILWDNIPPAYRYNFYAKKQGVIDHLGSSYDYYSVMHYPAKLFGGRIVIRPKPDKPEAPRKFGPIGSDLLSETDIKDINTLYCGDIKACGNNTPWCRVWASRGSRGLDSFCRQSAYMKKQCKKACGLCSV